MRASAWWAMIPVMLASAASAQTYPAKPVRFVVPYAAGGAVDAMARVFAQEYAHAWGQPVVVDNRAGAGGDRKSTRLNSSH